MPALGEPSVDGAGLPCIPGSSAPAGEGYRGTRQGHGHIEMYQGGALLKRWGKQKGNEKVKIKTILGKKRERVRKQKRRRQG